MIQLALLVGSDYTTGIPGIGPVTALEILAAFPTQGDNLLHGLINFYLWIQKDKAIDSSKKSLRNKLRNIKIEKGNPIVICNYLSIILLHLEMIISVGI